MDAKLNLTQTAWKASLDNIAQCFVFLCWSHYLLPLHKMNLWSNEQNIKKIPWGSDNHNYYYYYFVSFFEGIALKLENMGPMFSSSNLWQCLRFAAKDDRKQFQCLNNVVQQKLDPFGDLVDAKISFSSTCMHYKVRLSFCKCISNLFKSHDLPCI